MLERDLYWIAGLLEGEGYFTNSMAGKGRTHPTLRIGMNSTDRPVIERIASLTDTKVYGPYRHTKAKPHHKDHYEWMLNSTKAKELMLKIRPIMSPRRQEQIDAAIARWENITDISSYKQSYIQYVG